MPLALVTRSSFRYVRQLFLLRYVCLLLSVCLLFCAVGQPLYAQSLPVVRIGVLSFRSLQQTEQSWSPLAQWLESQIPTHHFKIIPLYYPDLGKAVETRQVDFVFTNPEHYVQLRSRNDLAAITTVMPLVKGKPVTQFAGVIFTKSDNRRIMTLHDLKGSTIAAPDKYSLGGYLMQCWELYRQGVDIRQSASFRFTGMPHDKVVDEVLSGRADVGFVRSGILESLTAEGKIRLEQIRVLNQQNQPDLPLMHSTELYPEWPFSALPYLDRGLIKQVTVALLSLPPSGEAAHAARIYGFSPPGNYGAIEAIMLRLKIHPDSQDFSLQDVFRRYANWLLLLLSLGLVSAFYMVFRMRRANRLLAGAKQELEDLNSTLAVRIDHALAENRRKDQALIEQNRVLALHSMLTNISHHWRQPLNNVAVIIQSLPLYKQSGELSDELLQSEVDRAMQCIQALSGTIDDFRNCFAKDTRESCFVVSHALKRVSHLLEATLLSNGIRVHTEFDQFGAISGYPHQFDQVVLTLLDNAKDACLAAKQPDAEICIGCRALEGYVLIWVSDNGCGISPDIARHLFEPYFSTKGMQKGSGLSLYMAKQIVEQGMHGVLSWQSGDGHTRFEIRCPACVAAPVTVEQ